LNPAHGLWNILENFSTQMNTVKNVPKVSYSEFHTHGILRTY